MAYGTVKVDNITFTNGGIDQTVTVSGIVQSISGNITATGTIQAATIIGTSTVSGATVTGDSGQYGNLNSISGVFTTQVSGATVTGNVGSFTTVTGGVATITSGVFALGTNALPSISFSGDPNTGIYSPGADQVAISTNGTRRLFVDSSGNVVVGANAAIQLFTLGEDTGGNPGMLSLGRGGSESSSIYWTRAGVNDAEITYGANEILNIKNNFNNAALTFSTNATERLRITSDGKLGLGSSTPGSYDGNSNNLVIANTSGNAGMSIVTSSTGDGTISWADGTTGNEKYRGSIGYNHANDRFTISTAAASRVTIDGSGRLLVGTSSAVTTSYSSALIQLATLTGGIFVASRDDSTVVDGTIVGGLSLWSKTTTNHEECATIFAEADGTYAEGDKPTRLVFSTTADGLSSPTERMSITAEGFICADSTTRTNKASVASNTGGFKFFAASSDSAVRCEGYTTSTSARYHISFSNPNGVVGSISTNASATAYNTSSDYRLKENVAPVTDGIMRLQQLKPSRFNFIADPNTVVDGFIAHEVQTVVPEAITGEKDAVDEDGNPQYQGIDQSKLVPLLTAALQEAVAKIESLEARLTAAGI